MPKWEYCYVCHHFLAGTEEIFIIKNDGVRENKFDKYDASLPNAIILINELGKQGWEVIGTTLNSTEHGWTLKKITE